jgi:hypothetical protein
MLEEFRHEWSTNPFKSDRLTAAGVNVFPTLMEKAIREGNEIALAGSLSKPEYWKTNEPYVRSGKSHVREVNYAKAAEVLAITEFNTWYVRGLARRLLDEGEGLCEVYRAAPAWQPRDECLRHDGRQYSVKQIFEGHRSRYWPPPGNPQALSIPVGPNCHHSIRRMKK